MKNIFTASLQQGISKRMWTHAIIIDTAESSTGYSACNARARRKLWQPPGWLNFRHKRATTCLRSVNSERHRRATTVLYTVKVSSRYWPASTNGHCGSTCWTCNEVRLSHNTSHSCDKMRNRLSRVGSATSSWSETVSSMVPQLSSTDGATWPCVASSRGLSKEPTRNWLRWLATRSTKVTVSLKVFISPLSNSRTVLVWNKQLNKQHNITLWILTVLYNYKVCSDIAWCTWRRNPLDERGMKVSRPKTGYTCEATEIIIVLSMVILNLDQQVWSYSFSVCKYKVQITSANI